MEHKHCLPDTPWHIGYVKKEGGDPRRHKARCVHIDSNGICKCPKSGCYTLKCNGSSHCKFYAETIGQWQSVRRNTLSIEEETTEAETTEVESTEEETTVTDTTEEESEEEKETEPEETSLSDEE